MPLQGHRVDCDAATIDDLLPQTSTIGLNVSRTLLAAAATNFPALVPSPNAG